MWALGPIEGRVVIWGPVCFWAFVICIGFWHFSYIKKKKNFEKKKTILLAARN